ncbi:MAG: ribose 5-phosphate isomerase B [Vicinamibacterales bacterium]
MRIAIASDHAGYRYKQVVVRWLQDRQWDVADFGTSSEEPVDYPDFVRPAAAAVAAGQCSLGIVFGGSGNGEAMAANRFRGIRCAVCWNVDAARYARVHNDANMIAIGSRFVGEDSLIAIVETWLDATFEGGRHVQRLVKLDA